MKSKLTVARAESAVIEFLETAADLVHRIDRALSIRGISFSEYRLLKELAVAHPSGCPRIDLADAVGLTPSAVTRALKPLEKLGYVTSQRNQRDARQSLATVSPAGLELLSDGQQVVRELFANLSFSGLQEAQVAEFKLRLLDLRS